VVFDQLPPCGLQYFKRNFVDINRLPFLILPSKQGQYAVEDFAGATAIIYYPVQIGRRFIDIGWHPYKKSASALPLMTIAIRGCLTS
jgi:hypothetical protein